MNKRHEDVQQYYGEELKSTEDLKTSACCPVGSMPDDIKPYIANINAEVLSKFYGCGSPIPPALEGQTVLDLGCGTGRDCYILSQMVGENGRVIGIDMTEEQLEVARKNLPWHMEKFGYKTPNIDFQKSYIEDLSQIESNSVDVVISNCVINLSAHKDNVFKEIFRVLKTGGELYFSDVFADKRIPEDLKDDPVLVGECLAGALYIEDFRRILSDAGCVDYRVMEKSIISLDDKEVEDKLGMVGFYSMTIRAFKCDFEDLCEDYGHVAYYQGGIEDAAHQFILDDHHVFQKGRPMLVCGNTAKMLLETRYKNFFKVEGDFSTHYGVFDCSGEDLPDKVDEPTGACC